MTFSVRHKFFLVLFLFLFSCVLAAVFTNNFLDFTKEQFSDANVAALLAENNEQFDTVVNEINDRIRNYGLAIGIWMMLILFGATIFTFLSLRSIFLRMYLLKQHFSTSDLDSLEPLKLPGNDELGDLLKVSNRMLMNFKEARSQLVKKNFIENVINSMTDFVFVCDKDRMIIEVNKVCSEQFQDKLLLGVDIINILRRNETKHGERLETIADSFSKGHTLSTEVYLAIGEKQIPVQLSCSPIRKDAGTADGAVVIARDLTSQHKAEKEKKAMEAQLQHSAKLASLGTLGAGVAHELNNPLAGVKGFAQLINNHGEATDAIKGFAKRIVQASERMQKTVEHIRRFSSDTSKEDPKVLDIRKPVDDAMFLLGSRIRLLGIEVVVKISTDLRNIIGDANEIESVFHNLFSNSIDAFEEINDERAKKILIDAKNRGDNSIVINFRDNASGIPKSKMSQIFDPFFSTKPVGKGTGLGLSIVHGIIQKHSGSVECSSVEGKETKFSIILPSTTQELAMEEAPSTSETSMASRATLSQFFSKKPRVLVVDDESIVLDVVKSFLESYFEVEAIANPQTGLKILKTRQFDLILVDIRMPGMNGLEFMSKIPAKNKQTPVIVLTGHAQSDNEVEEAIAMGAAAVVFKPLPSRDAFVGKLVDVIASEKEEAQEKEFALNISHEGKPQEGRIPTLLIVDDEPSLLEMFSLIFGNHFDVDTAGDAPTAFKRIKEKEYDVAMCDLFMKDTSGLILVETLKKESPKTAVFIVTGSDKESPESQACLTKGAKAIIQKPILSIEDTLKMLRNAVEK
ncbi:MAG: response regulator [Deltaproteobacteria bacterium]|nr:response regulator [Deltaproteobacteria bacterium]